MDTIIELKYEWEHSIFIPWDMETHLINENCKGIILKELMKDVDELKTYQKFLIFLEFCAYLHPYELKYQMGALNS